MRPYTSGGIVKTDHEGIVFVQILDPDGDVIAIVPNNWVSSLLSHLNRGG